MHVVIILHIAVVLPQKEDPDQQLVDNREKGDIVRHEEARQLEQDLDRDQTPNLQLPPRDHGRGRQYGPHAAPRPRNRLPSGGL